MKKLFLLLSFAATAATATAQCSTASQPCGNLLTLIGGALTNTLLSANASGNICLNATVATTVSNSVSFGPFGTLSLRGSLTIRPTINVSVGAKLFVGNGAVVSLNGLNLSGSDTVFVGAGASLNIATLNANNTGNVFVIAPDATLTIAGVTYTAPATVTLNGVTVQIIACTSPQLPVVIEYLTANGTRIGYKLAAFKDVAALYLEHSTTGADWQTIATLPVSVAPGTYEATEGGLYRLKVAEANGTFSYSYTISIKGTVPATGPAEVTTIDGVRVFYGELSSFRMQPHTIYIIRTATGTYRQARL